jgi:hypothetical protein
MTQSIRLTVAFFYGEMQMSTVCFNYERVDAIASRIPGFRLGPAPANLIDAMSIARTVMEMLEKFNPQSEGEFFSLLTHSAGWIRATDEYEKFQREHSKPCWWLVTDIAVYVIHDAAPLRTSEYQPEITVCVYPHVSIGDPWLLMPINQGGQDVGLAEQLESALTPRAMHVFSGYGNMLVEGGSDLVSPQRYTIFQDSDGKIDPVKTATGLTLVVADRELAAVYQATIERRQRLLSELRQKNPELFYPRSASIHSLTYFDGNGTLH